MRPEKGLRAQASLAADVWLEEADVMGFDEHGDFFADDEKEEELNKNEHEVD